MPKTENAESYRFVIVYRREPREIAGAASPWRGTLTAVPDSSGSGTEQRFAFSELDDLPQMIRDHISRRSREGLSADDSAEPTLGRGQ